MDMAPIRVLVADDHAVVRDGIVAILKACSEIRVVGEAGDGAEATRKALETRPDVVILDVSMPGLSGVEAARRIHDGLPDARILALTMHEEDEYVVGMFRAGASGYLTKDAAPSDLLDAVRALRDGGVYFSPGAFRSLVRAYRENGREPKRRAESQANGK